jgi:hypothetical protein
MPVPLCDFSLEGEPIVEGTPAGPSTVGVGLLDHAVKPLLVEQPASVPA